MYEDARSFFHAVRDARLGLDAMDRALAQMRQRTGLRAIDYSAVHVHGGQHDQMAQSDAIADYERATERQRAQMQHLLDAGMAVLFGRDGMGGVAALMDMEHANVMMWRYVHAMQWNETARLMMRSPHWCCDAADAVMEMCDSYGMERMLEGVGMAEDS